MDELSEEAKSKQALGFARAKERRRERNRALARAQERAARDDRSGFCVRGSGFLDQTWNATLFGMVRFWTLCLYVRNSAAVTTAQRRK